MSRKVKRFQIAMKDTLIKVEVKNVYLRYTETKSTTILKRYSHVIFLSVFIVWTSVAGRSFNAIYHLIQVWKKHNISNLNWGIQLELNEKLYYFSSLTVRLGNWRFYLTPRSMWGFIEGSYCLIADEHLRFLDQYLWKIVKIKAINELSIYDPLRNVVPNDSEHNSTFTKMLTLSVGNQLLGPPIR